MSVPIPAQNSRKTKTWIGVAALMLLCLLVRLPGLMELPIFGDEAIYLRWAQLIREHHWWVSLADPKPPLHFWLIALVFKSLGDPLLAARLISVAAGVVCVPLMIWIADELGHFLRDSRGRPSARLVGLIGAGLMIVCPFIAFYQRLATQDALFTMESMAVVWLSLRWARRAAFGVPPLGGRQEIAEIPSAAGGAFPIAETPPSEILGVDSGDEPRPPKGGTPSVRAPGAWFSALLLGIAIGAGLLTRQGVSYTICAFPVAAWLIHRIHERRTARPRIAWVRSFVQLGLAAVVAAAMWTPYLTAELGKFDKPGAAQVEIKRRIFYQDSFVGGPGERLNIASRNMRLAFVPRWVGGHVREPNSGWLFLYMTPPLFVLGLAGLAYLAFRNGRVFLLVLIWLVLLIGPLIFLANTIYSRYMLAGVPPLLFAAAVLLADGYALLKAGGSRRVLFRAAIALPVAGLSALWPAIELSRQIWDWSNQTLTTGRGEARADRYQYITGWTAGYATREAIAYLRDAAREAPVAVITASEWGTPADALWVYLSDAPNTQVYLMEGGGVMRPGAAAGTFRLRVGKWVTAEEKQVAFAAGTRVFFVCNDPVHTATADVPATTHYFRGNPNLGPPKTFYGVEGRGGEGVSVFPVSTTGPWPRGRGG